MRVRKLNDATVRTPGGYVLYWSQMNRRVESNHALAYAATLANEFGLPLLFYEGLTCTYPHANDRLHTFLLEGVPETERRAAELGIGYVFYLRRRRCAPDDVLYRLADDAAAVVTDDYPSFIAAEHNARVPKRIGVAYFAVDSSCVAPMNCFEKREYGAYTIRPKIHKLLPDHLKPVSRIALKRRWKCPRPRFHTAVNANSLGELVAASENRPRGGGYCRMYWGKKIIEWSPTFQEAFDTMVYIHDRFALDGRDPNTYANILWCFGLHDRSWPERPVFGTMRYMSIEGMKRKTKVADYIQEIERLERNA